jgi:hypothetical protein
VLAKRPPSSYARLRPFVDGTGPRADPDTAVVLGQGRTMRDTRLFRCNRRSGSRLDRLGHASCTSWVFRRLDLARRTKSSAISITRACILGMGPFLCHVGPTSRAGLAFRRQARDRG